MREFRVFLHFIFVLFCIVMMIICIPQKISILKEDYQSEIVCKYKYNVDKCSIDYSNDYIKVFKTDKGYIIYEK